MFSIFARFPPRIFTTRFNVRSPKDQTTLSCSRFNVTADREEMNGWTVRGLAWIVKHANYLGACLNGRTLDACRTIITKGSDTSRQVPSHNAVPTNITALSSPLNRYFRLAMTAPWLLSSLPFYDRTQRVYKVDLKRTDDLSRSLRIAFV